MATRKAEEELSAPPIWDYEDDSSPEIHLWDYVQIVLQRLPLAISVFAAVVAISIVYTWTRVPRYRAVARILIESTQIDLTDLKGAYDPVTAGLGQREFIQTQVKLITSRPVMEATFEKAGLDSNPAYLENNDPIQKLTEAVSAEPVRNTYLIDISTDHTDRKQSARIVNAVVDSFLAENRKRYLRISEDGLQELYKKADSLREKLEASTQALQDFMVANNVVSFEKTQNIILDRLRDLSKKLTEKEPVRIALQAQVAAGREALENGRPVDSLPEVMASRIISSLKMDLARLENDYSQMLQRLGDSHPQIQAVTTQIDALKTKLAMEASTILMSLETRYDQAKMEEELLHEALRKHEKEVFRFNDLATEYNVLRQKKESVENTYQTIIRRVQEIDINRTGAQGNNIFVISRAIVPTMRCWPSRGKNLLIAVFFGGGLAVALCFFLDYMDRTVKSELDVRSLLGTDVLAGIPQQEPDEDAKYHPDLVSLHQPRGNIAESFRALRTNLAFSAGGESLRQVVVTSALPQEGKSLVAINLALAEAQTNRRTLLIDADLRKPRLHTVFGVSAVQGLTSLLLPNSKISLNDVIVNTEIENLSFLPSGPIPPRPVEMLDSPRFTQLLKEASANFDFIILDSPPAIEMVDAMVMSKRADGVLLVVRSFATPKTSARETVSHFRQADVRMAGVVLNNVDKPPGAYYGYGAYAHAGTHYYYGRPQTSSTNADSIKNRLASLIGLIPRKPRSNRKV